MNRICDILTTKSFLVFDENSTFVKDKNDTRELFYELDILNTQKHNVHINMKKRKVSRCDRIIV